MSLLSSFIADHLIKSLEAEFVKHEPDLQQAFVQEVQAFSGEVLKWIEAKTQGQAQ